MPIKYNIFSSKSLLVALIAMGLLNGCDNDKANDDNQVTVPVPAPTPDPEDTALAFDANSYTTVNVIVDGEAVAVRQYRIVYVANPIEVGSVSSFGTTASLAEADRHIYQTMIVSVPEVSFEDQDAALYFQVNNAGWFTSPASTNIQEGAEFNSTLNGNSGVLGSALKAGYVVIDVGTRSRGARAIDGRWVGKAPAPVVDSKAAIRYLRLNDALMPGSAERIVVTGTSGGGGLTSAVAASGNSADYLPFLAVVGAAGVSGEGDNLDSSINDDVFAAVAYCPINNLGNADAGYEWQFNAIRGDDNSRSINNVAYSVGPQPAASAAIAELFPKYLSQLELKVDDDNLLTAANINELTMALLKEEIEAQIAAGTSVPAYGENFSFTVRNNLLTPPNDWLTLSGSGVEAKVESIDFSNFLRFVSKTSSLKSTVAFDAVAVTGNPNISGETNLFGSQNFDYANFSEWSWNNNEVIGDGSGTDDTGLIWQDYLDDSGAELATQIKLINPLEYLNTAADSAPYWYVRHGMIDRDTAFAMQVTLFYAIKNDPSVQDINFKLPYLIPHSGNYDVQEAFAWIQAKLAAN